MRRAALASAAAVVAVATAWTLAGAAWNRAGEPTSEMRLTERELTLDPAAEEDSAVTLRLRWSGGWNGWSGPWLDAAAERLGLGLALPATNEVGDVERAVELRRARRVAVALELDGEAWRDELAGLERRLAAARAELAPQEATDAEVEALERELAVARVRGSRLVPIDADRDAAALRARHPDRARVAVVAGLVEPWVERVTGEPPRVRARIARVFGTGLQVPPRLQALLRRLQAADEALAASGTRPGQRFGTGADERPPQPPRYAGVVRWGRRLEPWLVAVEPLAPDAANPATPTAGAGS